MLRITRRISGYRLQTQSGSGPLLSEGTRDGALAASPPDDRERDTLPGSALSTEALGRGTFGHMPSDSAEGSRRPLPQVAVEPCEHVDAYYRLDPVTGANEASYCPACMFKAKDEYRGAIFVPFRASNGAWNLVWESNDGEVCEGCGKTLLEPVCLGTFGRMEGCGFRSDDCERDGICEALAQDAASYRPRHHGSEWDS